MQYEDRARAYEMAIADVTTAIKLYDHVPGTDNAPRLCSLLLDRARMNFAWFHGRGVHARQDAERALKLMNRLLQENPRRKRNNEDAALAMTILAWILSASPEDDVRNGELAQNHAERACELTNWKDAFSLQALASAHAENGQFGDAAKHQRQALNYLGDHSSNEGQPNRDLQMARNLLELYEADKSFRSDKENNPFLRWTVWHW